MQSWVSEWMPPRVLRVLRRVRGQSRVRYTGDFPSWEEARRQSQGYESEFILERVRKSQSQVRQGLAAFERDGVTFDRIEHSFPLLAALARVAAIYSGRLNVLDFGGGLGGSYSQCRMFLERLPSFSWNIVEQANFVACGKAEFENSELRFYPDVQSCLAEQNVNVILLSGVLQYVERPFELIRELNSARIPHCIVDRTPLFDDRPRRLTVQQIPASVYGEPASYPAWIFNREEFCRQFAAVYDIVLEFVALGGVIDLVRAYAVYSGYVLDLKTARLTGGDDAAKR